MGVVGASQAAFVAYVAGSNRPADGTSTSAAQQAEDRCPRRCLVACSPRCQKAMRLFLGSSESYLGRTDGDVDVVDSGRCRHDKAATERLRF